MTSKHREFLQSMGATHEALGAECTKASEAEDTPPGLKKTFAVLATHHDAAAGHCVAACKVDADELEKADDSELVQELRGLVKALGGVVTPLPGGLSLIPRFGARDPRAEKSAASKVDPIVRSAILPDDEPAAPSVEWTNNRTQ